MSLTISSQLGQSSKFAAMVTAMGCGLWIAVDGSGILRHQLDLFAMLRDTGDTKGHSSAVGSEL